MGALSLVAGQIIVSVDVDKLCEPYPVEVRNLVRSALRVRIWLGLAGFHPNADDDVYELRRACDVFTALAPISRAVALIEASKARTFAQALGLDPESPLSRSMDDALLIKGERDPLLLTLEKIMLDRLAFERRRRYIAFAFGCLLGAVAASLFFIFRT